MPSAPERQCSARSGTFRTLSDPSLKICLYRFAQEGLNNAFRHAEGKARRSARTATTAAGGRDL